MKHFIYFPIFLLSLCMTACSQEVLRTLPEPEKPAEVITYATFTINTPTYAGPETQALTRAVADFNPGSTQSGNAATEMLINPADVRLMIFDYDGLLEYNDLFPVNLKTTVLITAGYKTIFVFANCGHISGFNTLFNSFTTGTSLSQFYTAAVYDAGTPQQADLVNKTTASRTFNITPLHTQSPSYGLPLSSSNQATYQLIANITETDSNNSSGSGSVISGNIISNPDNHFTLDLHFMLAKARLTYNSSALTHIVDATPVAEITNIRYAIHNLARYTNYVLNTTGGSLQDGTPSIPRSWYYGKITGSYDFSGHFDRASNVMEPATVVAIPQTGPFLYVPESNHNPMYVGNCPFFSFNAQYMPKYVVTTVGYNAGSTPKVQFSYTDLSAPTEVDKDYVYFRGHISGVGGDLDTGVYFKTVDLLRQAAWLTYYGGGWTGLQAQIDEADLLIGSPPPAVPPASFPSSYNYFLYTDAQSWYRVNVGGTLSLPDIPYSIPSVGTIRGVAYDTNITDFKGPGLPYEWMSDYTIPDGVDPIEANTHVTVTTRVFDWAHALRDATAN